MTTFFLGGIQVGLLVQDDHQSMQKISNSLWRSLRSVCGAVESFKLSERLRPSKREEGFMISMVDIRLHLGELEGYEGEVRECSVSGE